MTNIGIMVCGHGSRDVDAVTEFQSVADGIRARLPQYDVDSGFLEFATPIIRDRLEALRQRGNKRIIAVPGMLFAAGHVKNDLPSVINTYAAQHPDLEITYGRDLGLDMKLIRAAGDRIKEAMATAGDHISPEETLLVVVGRGASDPDANSNIAKVCRLLWEGLGFGWAEVAYSGVTFPLVEPGLQHAAKLGYKRIIVFPYFLFTGILVRRIYHYTDEVAARHPDIEFVKASYLNDHPLVLDAFADRVKEALDGANNMNCQMCVYREQVLGFEASVGLPQESHHHHVEGIGTGKISDAEFDPAAHVHGGHDHDHGHDHGRDHGHSHGHDHGHHPYPHADHPLGPRSMLKK
ncbi:MAG: sirohydrochlorin chelatase [Alphaproteobacteria bacterium]|nr:sirohydrochlorin chelatase [Alphaproteobacteria bacterium]